MEPVALPDPILPPALAFELGRTSEGRFISSWPYGCDCFHDDRVPFEPIVRPPGPKPGMPRWARRIARER